MSATATSDTQSTATAPKSNGSTASETLGADATKQPAAGVGAASVPSKYRLNLEGEEREYELDALRTNFLKGKQASGLLSKAEQRLKKAQEIEDRYASLPERLKQDARGALEEMGLNPREIAEAMLLPEIQREMMSEEQRELAEERGAHEKLKAKFQAREDAERHAQEEQRVAQEQERLGEQIVAALEKTGLPRESAPWAVRRMAALMDRNLELGLDLPPDEIASLVREDFENEHKSITTALSGEQLVKWLGEETVKKIRDFDLGRLKSRFPTATKAPLPGSTDSTASAGAKRSYLTQEEMDAEIKRRIQE